MSVIVEMDNVYKGLVTLAIEKTLLDIDKVAYHKVVEMLNQEYQCYLSDCYENPACLSQTLKKLYGNSYRSVTLSITEQLADFSSREVIARFINTIHQ
jgi:hypothetical protein